MALEARVRVPRLQLRRRHATPERHRGAQIPGRWRPPRDRPRVAGREPTGHAHHAGYRHDPPPEPRARRGSAAGSTRRRARPRDRARGDRRSVLAPVTAYDSVPGLDIALDGGVLTLRWSRPEKRNALN